MSRHRNIRNLGIDGVLDEDECSDDYNDDKLYEGDLNEDDRVQLEDGLAHVHGIVGKDTLISDAEIKELYWDFYFDREKTVEEVLETIRKIRAEEEKQKKAVRKAKDDDRKPRFRRRQTSKAPSDTIPTTTTMQQPSSPLSKSQQPKSISSLSSLAQKTALATASKRPSSLQSLAQKTASQRGMTALQMLASRQQQKQSPIPGNTTASPTTATATKPTSSLAALAQKSTKSKTTNLVHLATRSRPMTDTSAAKANSLAGLAYRAKVTRQTPEIAPKEDSEIVEKPAQSTFEEDQKIEEEQSERMVAEKMELDTPSPGITNASSQHPTLTLNDVVTVHNPLCAPPSAAANFLFMRTGAATPKPSDHATSFDSVGKAFYDAVRASSNSIHVFTFDVPSPDDIVLDAQAHRGGGQIRKS